VLLCAVSLPICVNFHIYWHISHDFPKFLNSHNYKCTRLHFSHVLDCIKSHTSTSSFLFTALCSWRMVSSCPTNRNTNVPPPAHIQCNKFSNSKFRNCSLIVDLQKVQKMSMRVDKGISASIVQVTMIQDNMHKCSTCTEAQTFAQHNKQVLV